MRELERVANATGRPRRLIEDFEALVRRRRPTSDRRSPCCSGWPTGTCSATRSSAPRRSSTRRWPSIRPRSWPSAGLADLLTRREDWPRLAEHLARSGNLVLRPSDNAELLLAGRRGLPPQAQEAARGHRPLHPGHGAGSRVRCRPSKASSRSPGRRKTGSGPCRCSSRWRWPRTARAPSARASASGRPWRPSAPATTTAPAATPARCWSSTPRRARPSCATGSTSPTPASGGPTCASWANGCRRGSRSS